MASVRRRSREYDHAGGDAFVLAAALFYSLSTVRLSRLAPSVPSLPLAAAKSLALAGVSLVWLGASVLHNVSPFKLTPGLRHSALSGLILSESTALEEGTAEMLGLLA